MKNVIYTLIITLFVTLAMTAQAPEKFNYQTVVRDGSGNILANQNVSLRFKIHETSAVGAVQYEESHSATTNDFGLVNLEIGGGVVGSGSFATIDWGSDSYYIEVELDPAGGNSFTSMGTSQLLSVPYALSAEKASAMELSDLTNVSGTPSAGQVLKWDGAEWKPQNDLTSGGGGGSYSAGTGISISGSNVISSDLGTDIATNEIQNDAVTNAKIANNAVNTSQLTNDAVTNAKIANNAVNTSQLADNAVNAAKIDPMGAANGEVLKWNGTDWAPATDATGGGGTTYSAGSGISISGSNAISADLGTDIATNEIQNSAVTNAKIANNAVNTSQIANDAVTASKIDDMGAAKDDVLKWDGSNWAPVPESASAWTTSGADVYRSTGDVGIGTTNPTSKLHVDGQVKIFEDGNALQLRGLNPYLSFYNGGINTGFLSSTPTSFDLTTPSGSTQDLTLSTGLTNRFTIKSGGEIGIGLSNPVNMFSILQPISSSNTVRIESQDHNFGKDLLELVVPSTASNTSQFIEFQQGNTIVAHIDADGSAQFEDVEFGDGTVQTTAAIGPIAFGTVTPSGIITNGSGNFTVSYNSSGDRYEISITGVTYHVLSYTTLITPTSTNIAEFRTISGSGDLVVSFKNGSGIGVQSGFCFIVYE